MTIRVEFYGIPRQRAGCDHCVVEYPAAAVSLGELLTTLATRFPQLAAECFDGPHLRAGYMANVGGERFVRNPETVLPTETMVLILSTDAGG